MLSVKQYEEFRPLLPDFWQAGDLRYKLWTQQEPIYNNIRSLPREVDEAVVLCARQFGKSHLGTILAVEDCFRYPNRCILIVGPTYDQTREIVTPRLKQVIADAPRGWVKPLKSEKKWMIGDSELVIGGFDINSSSQRGKTVQNIYIEEVVDSKPDHFLESLRSDLGPAMTHSDAGKMIYLTTLPKIPDHPFVTEILPQARSNDALYSYTIHDNKALTQEQFDACVRRAGGMHTDDFRREYLNELIRDRNLVIIPDFNEGKHVGTFADPTYQKFECFIDWGGVRDLTVALIMSYDFYNDMDLVYDELVWPSNTATEHIVTELRPVLNRYGITAPGTVYVDCPGQLLVDLKETHKLPVILPSKVDWQANVNQLAVRFANDRIKIKPHLKHLIACCNSATFNKHKTDFERTITLGHADGIAALMYGNRNLDRRSLYPAQLYSKDNYVIIPREQPNTVQSIVPKSFVGRGLRRFTQ